MKTLTPKNFEYVLTPFSSKQIEQMYIPQTTAIAKTTNLNVNGNFFVDFISSESCNPLNFANVSLKSHN